MVACPLFILQGLNSLNKDLYENNDYWLWEYGKSVGSTTFRDASTLFL